MRSDNSGKLPDQYCSEVDEPVFTIILSNITTVASDYVMYVYRGSTNVTSTYASGSIAVTNGFPSNITLKKLSGLKGGDTLRVTIKATMNGIMQSRFFWLHVSRLSGK